MNFKLSARARSEAERAKPGACAFVTSSGASAVRIGSNAGRRVALLAACVTALVWCWVGRSTTCTLVFVNDTGGSLNPSWTFQVGAATGCGGGTQTDTPSGLCGAGQTCNYTATWGLTALSYHIWANCGSGTHDFGCVNGDPAGQTFTVTASSCTLTSPPPVYCASVSYTNVATEPVYVSLWITASCLNSGHPLGDSNLCMIYPGLSNPSAAVWLPVGGIAGVTECLDCPWTAQFAVQFASAATSASNAPPVSTNGLTTGSITNSQSSGTNSAGLSGFRYPTNLSGIGPGPGGNMGGTAAGSGNNTNLTGNQFYTGLTNLGNLTWQGYQAINGTLGYLTNLGALNGITNGSSGSGTNYSGMNGTGFGGVGTNVYSTFLDGGGGGGNGTNGNGGTNVMGGVLNTNAAEEAFGESASNAWVTGMPAGAKGLLVSSNLIPGAGTISLDPADIMPGAPSLIKTLLNWVMTAGFVVWIVKQYRRAASDFLAAQGGGVPDLEVVAAGFGGNAAGVATAIVVPVVLAGLWITALLFLLGRFGVHINAVAANPFSSWTGNASMDTVCYLLNEFVDWPYLLGLLGGRIVYGLSMAKLVIAAASATRFLWTR